MTLYEELGIEPDASDETIAQAHRRRVKETHPDVGGDREEFEKVQRAAIVLRDPEKRKKYDRTGETDDRPNNDAAELANVLTQAFDQALSQTDGQYNDVIAKAKAYLVSGREGLRSQTQAQKAQQDKTQSALKRLKFKGLKSGKIDLLANVLAHRLIGIAATLASIEAQDRLLVNAIDFMKYYGWDYDKPNEPGFGSSADQSFQEHQQRMRAIFSK